jgi:hypothetical protein
MVFVAASHMHRVYCSNYCNTLLYLCSVVRDLGRLSLIVNDIVMIPDVVKVNKIHPSAAAWAPFVVFVYKFALHMSTMMFRVRLMITAALINSWMSGKAGKKWQGLNRCGACIKKRRVDLIALELRPWIWCFFSFLFDF